MVSLEDYKIAIFTRSANYKLYKMSDSTIELPFKHYRFTFTTAHGYLYKILKYNIDYAINIDEDAFVVDNNALLELLKYCIEEKIVNCGMRDGGVSPVRYGNPIVTNPFFNILDVRQIRKKFSKREVGEYRYKIIDYDKLLKNVTLPFKYENTPYYESFYPFFLWLNVNSKVYYLNATEHDDKFSTILYNQLGEKMLYHSWYSREFEKNEFHTQRIMDLYCLCEGKDIRLSFSEKIRVWLELRINQNVIPWILPIRRKLIKLMSSK
ncbi:hypothetical protein SDC9_27772 [bioreactor metagenome]|jgi:hypothetical protein|uniref:Uncharacterized protein n=1 Tax=bioreactor metagenome TaxID=1076179 RepID=A0A644USK1_9ZZZZ